MLTDKEIHLLDLISTDLGMTNRELADKLEIKPVSVRTRLRYIARKLQIPAGERVSSRILLAYWWNCPLFRVGIQEIRAEPRLAGILKAQAEK